MATLAQTIRWIIHQVIGPLLFPEGAREMAFQILIAQSVLRKSIGRGMLPRRLRTKKYFQDAVLLFGIESEAKGEKVPRDHPERGAAGSAAWWPRESKERGTDGPEHDASRLLHQQLREQRSNLRKEKSRAPQTARLIRKG